MEASGGLSSLGGIVKPEYRQAQARALVSKKIAPPTGERRPPHGIQTINPKPPECRRFLPHAVGTVQPAPGSNMSAGASSACVPPVGLCVASGQRFQINNCCPFFFTASPPFLLLLQTARKNPRDLGSQFAKGGADLFV